MIKWNNFVLESNSIDLSFLNQIIIIYWKVIYKIWLATLHYYYYLVIIKIWPFSNIPLSIKLRIPLSHYNQKLQFMKVAKFSNGPKTCHHSHPKAHDKFRERKNPNQNTHTHKGLNTIIISIHAYVYGLRIDHNSSCSSSVRASLCVFRKKESITCSQILSQRHLYTHELSLHRAGTISQIHRSNPRSRWRAFVINIRMTQGLGTFHHPYKCIILIRHG